LIGRIRPPVWRLHRINAQAGGRSYHEEARKNDPTVNPERWRQIESLFEQAVECPPAERSSFLDRSCQGDDALRREVESLLACDDPESLIEVSGLPVLDGGAEAEAPADMAGRRVGPYRLVRLLGQGGMGSVHLAVRDDDQYQKQVAIKLLRRELDTGLMMSRFRQERQILANLEHPFIARLLDGGTADDGIPYLVMEYVDGLPITAFCSESGASIQARLALFRLVCEAVQYAHQNLVVHRDLKPGNILITREGIPKLLDFGIAKLISPRSTGRTLTQDLRMMTPDYASPEQARGQAISTASDIYSLGAVLYELLTGQRPHRFTSDSFAEIERTICDVEPERPSRAVERETGGSARDLKRRSRQLAGDLDNIILTALRKEPDRRYASVAELSEDLRRHLEGLPVAAREDRFWYRAGKFVRRNKLGVAAAVLVGLSLIGGIAATAYQARRAERRFQLVRQLANSMLYDLNDQLQVLPGSTAIRASMVQTVLRYLDSLAQDAGRDPVFDLEMVDAYRRIGNVEGSPLQANLGQTAAALEHYRKALEICERVPDRADVLEWKLGSIIGLNIEAGDIEARTGNTAAAAARLQKVAAMAADPRTRLAPGTWIYIYFRLSSDEQRRGVPEGTLVYARKALQIAQGWAAAEKSVNARSTLRGAYANFAGALRDSGDLDGARENFERALQVVEEALRQPNFTVNERVYQIGTYQSLGDILGDPEDLNLGDRAGALSNYTKALELAERLAPADRQNLHITRELSDALRRLGMLLLEENPAGALEYFERSLALTRKLTEANPSNLEYRADHALRQLSIAEALLALRRKEAVEAASYGLEMAHAAVAAFPGQIPRMRLVTRAHRVLGGALLEGGERDRALESLRSGLESAEKLLQRAPASLYLQWDRADAYESLGRCYAKLAAREARSTPRRSELAAEAKQWFRKSLGVWQDWTRRGVAPSYARMRESRAAAAIASAAP
jgi:serine/threonine protein kinase